MNWIGKLLRKEILKADSVLDLGSGIIQWAEKRLPVCSEYVAVDAYEEYLNHLPCGVTERRLGMLPRVCADFEDRSFDVVLMIDVLEHLTTEDGYATLLEAERIARRDIYVYTPIGLMKQEACDAWGLGHNPLQEHISGWQVSDLTERGYSLRKIAPTRRGKTMLMQKGIE